MLRLFCFLKWCAVLAGALWWAGVASRVAATPLPVTIHVSDGVNTADFNPDGTINADQVFSSKGSYDGGTWSLDWSLSGASDETNSFVSHFNSIAGYWDLTNKTLTTQTYQIIVTLPVVPINPSSLASGVLGASVYDLNDGNATMTTNDFLKRPILAVQIDGVDFKTLGAWPTSTDFGLFDYEFPLLGLPPFHAPPVNSSIDIRNDFTLTAGDKVELGGSLSVSPVPEPCSLLLLVIGGLWGLAFRTLFTRISCSHGSRD